MPRSPCRTTTTSKPDPLIVAATIKPLLRFASNSGENVLASGNGTAPQTVNGTRAERRRVQNNTPMPGAVGAAEQTLAQVIGETVALHLAQMLGQVLARMPYLGECARCIRSAKLGIRAYEVKVANAQQAAEPVPER